jgi:hypothetical protein
MYPSINRRYRAKLAVYTIFAGTFGSLTSSPQQVELGASVDRENSSLIRDYNQHTSADALLFLDLGARLAVALLQPPDIELLASKMISAFGEV